MPVTKKITAPEGWTIRSNTISIPRDTVWDSVSAALSYKTLQTWAKRNNYQLKHSTYSLVRLNSWAELYLWTSFSFSKSKNPTDLFKPFSCSCGQNISTEDLICPSCGFVFSCNKCYIGGTTLVNTPGDNNYFCIKCCKTCSSKDCDNPFSPKENFDKCYKCAPRSKCMSCSKDVEGSKAKKHTSKGKTWNLCATCYDNVICSKCKIVGSIDLFGDQKLCAECKQEILDKERESLEAWPSEELPISGSMLIPATPSRPVRTISIETEFDGNGSEVCRALYQAGLVESPRRESYRVQAGRGDRFPCVLKSDSSVSGGELVSYLLDLDNENHAAALLRTTEVMRSCREQSTAKFTSNAGGHIHIDLHGYSQDDLWSYYTLFKFLELPIYYIGGAGSSTGHRSLEGNNYANPPNGGPFGSKTSFERGIVQTGRSGLNLGNFFASLNSYSEDQYGRPRRPCGCGKIAEKKWEECTCSLGKATAEWRVWNSCIVPRILHAQIALMQAVTAYAQENDSITEKKFEYLPWTEMSFSDLGTRTKEKLKLRLEWMHKELPLTTDERDSLVYACKKSEMIGLGEEYLENLLLIPSESSIAEKKKARNPYKRAELSFKKKEGKAERPLENDTAMIEEALRSAQSIEFLESPIDSFPSIDAPYGCDCESCMRARRRVQQQTSNYTSGGYRN